MLSYRLFWTCREYVGASRSACTGFLLPNDVPSEWFKRVCTIGTISVSRGYSATQCYSCSENSYNLQQSLNIVPLGLLISALNPK